MTRGETNINKQKLAQNPFDYEMDDVLYELLYTPTRNQISLLLFPPVHYFDATSTSPVCHHLQVRGSFQW